MSKYRDQIRDARKWSLIEAGYSEDLTPELKRIAKEKADELFEEAKAEIAEIEAEEAEVQSMHDVRYKRSWDAA